MAKDYDKDDEFGYDDIDPEILSLVGIFNILRNTNEGQEIILHFKNGQAVSGVKKMFDEETGIIGIHAHFEIAKKSELADKPITEQVNIYSRYRLSEIVGISTFPNITK